MDSIGINNTNLAKHIGVDRKTISRLVNGQTHVTTEMALRLSKAFDTSPQLWLNMQNQYDLWHAEESFNIPDINPVISHAVGL
jgi:addiction module HigA family antidote